MSAGVRCEPDHLDPVELLEEAAREVVRLDLVLGGGVVQRRDGVRRRRVGRILRRDVPELLQLRLRLAGQPAHAGTVEHRDPDADDRRARLGPGPTGRRRRTGRPGRVGAPGAAERAAGRQRGRAPTAAATAAVAQRGEGLIDHDDAPDDQGDDDREPERAGGQGEVEAPVGRWLVHAILPQGYRGSPSRRARRLRRRDSRSLRNRRTSIGSYRSASGRSIARIRSC